MEPQTFEHNGVAYTVAPLSIYRNSKLLAVMVDVGNIIAHHYGYESIEDKAFPRVLDTGVADFTHYLSMTKTAPDVPHCIDLFSVLLQPQSHDAIISAWQAWQATMLADDKLAEAWLSAIHAARATSQKKENG